MAGFRERGKTFLLVSHSLDEVTSNCTRAIWISEGRILQDGPADAVCAAYHAWALGGTPA
jgi:ABC-type polysaccharide/polyol phosphate transport system ATPase subunit